jgi:putative FmdB family regulatory protein
MPLYSYKCQSCGHIQDNFFSLNDKKIVNCESCRSTNMKQYFGGHNVSFHGFTEYDDPRGTGGKLTMKEIKEIEKKQKLVYGGHNELQQEAQKNRQHNENKIKEKLEGIIDKSVNTLHKKYNS